MYNVVNIGDNIVLKQCNMLNVPKRAMVLQYINVSK